MEYLTVKESAKKWGLSIRAVQQLCEQGRIPGIQKFGKSWAIPAEAEKPEGVRSRNGENTGSQASSSQESLLIDTENLMPLMNSPFQPGHCLEAIAAMPTGLKRDIAMANTTILAAKRKRRCSRRNYFWTTRTRVPSSLPA